MMGCYLQFQNAWMLFSFPSFLVARWLAPVVPWLGNTFATEKRYKYYKDLWEETERQRNIASRTTFVQGAQFDDKEGKYQLEGGLKMSAYDITRDITTFLGAGGEPIGATLVYLIYIVLQNTELRQELEAEAKALQEPCKSPLLMSMSKRSAHF